MRPALAGAAGAGVAFLASGAPWSALAAGGWTFAIGLLLALRAAQQRQALTLERALHELRQQLRVTHRDGVAMRRELYDLAQQLRATELPIRSAELEAAEEVDPDDEPTRAVPVPERAALGWRKRFALHWSVSR